VIFEGSNFVHAFSTCTLYTFASWLADEVGTIVSEEAGLDLLSDLLIRCKWNHSAMANSHVTKIVTVRQWP